jgi:hypothetical protein
MELEELNRIDPDEYATLFPDATDLEKILLAACQLCIGWHYGSKMSDNEQYLARVIEKLARRNLPAESFLADNS